eukprot:GHVN01039746.1.p1 GENE.GHVN01039746.1~~GHVN01039746.1.p1  ORF type:complete len:411 (+),score=122.02 GHVN01039746.1:86-1234(+)
MSEVFELSRVKASPSRHSENKMRLFNGRHLRREMKLMDERGTPHLRRIPHSSRVPKSCDAPQRQDRFGRVNEFEFNGDERAKSINLQPYSHPHQYNLTSTQFMMAYLSTALGVKSAGIDWPAGVSPENSSVSRQACHSPHSAHSSLALISPLSAHFPFSPHPPVSYTTTPTDGVDLFKHTIAQMMRPFLCVFDDAVRGVNEWVSYNASRLEPHSHHSSHSPHAPHSPHPPRSSSKTPPHHILSKVASSLMGAVLQPLPSQIIDGTVNNTGTHRLSCDEVVKSHHKEGGVESLWATIQSEVISQLVSTRNFEQNTEIGEDGVTSGDDQQKEMRLTRGDVMRSLRYLLTSTDAGPEIPMLVMGFHGSGWAHSRHATICFNRSKN